jgi:fructosamine-3-kinase
MTGRWFFLKQNPKAGDMFEKEAEGLKALRIPGGPIVPRVYLVGKTYLLMEDLQPGAHCQDFWEQLGRQLARVHNQVQDRYGFQEDNYIGSNPQKNGWMEDGHDFYRERRLMPQMQQALQRSLLTAEDEKALQTLMRNLSDLVPHQPASLLHGDLWSGNLITNDEGLPVIIDPAVYYGWAEADLAMTDLFGSFPEEFYFSYVEIRNLEPGYRDRYPLYNLYHLLNHLNLFGRGYLPQVRQILSRYK